MRTKLLIILAIAFLSANMHAMKYRGVVYDVGLQFNPGQYSVEEFNPQLVDYDMTVIADSLHCNAVRIEGEDIDRLETATVIADQKGLKVFFNPWLMNKDAEEVAAYMAKAARTAERLRKKGIDVTFVAGCEYSLFNYGVFDGNSVDKRIKSLMKLQELQDKPQKLKETIDNATMKLNKILAKIVKGVRENFKGEVTYSAGMWENVAWTMFDVIGLDFYRYNQTDEEYIAELDNYKKFGKPIIAMELGCCAFEGAGPLGSYGHAKLQGVDKNGNGIYEGGIVPTRSEKEQADYYEQQIRLLANTDIDGVFIYVFSFPLSPYRENGLDSDMTAYPIVKTFPKDDPRSSQMPPWQPKEAFHRIAATYKDLIRK